MAEFWRKSEECIGVVEMLWVAATPVTFNITVVVALSIRFLPQQHHVGAISALLALAVIVVRICVRASPPLQTHI